ncbi:MAG: hypothetical protein ACYC0X_04845 [Pirellulaceae bacterium]
MNAKWLCVMLMISSASPVIAGVDLGISDDETFKRPNSWSKLENGKSELIYAEAQTPSSRPGISIAWRNANQVEEVEVRVQNLGDEPGEGRLFVDVLDKTGKVLLHLEPPDEFKIIRVPAFEKGGREGKIVRMKASWELNTMIDRFDLTRTQYGVRATIETTEGEVNWKDNSKVKEWNIPFRVEPSHANVFNYSFVNTSDRPVKVRWMWESTETPPNWKIEGIPEGKEAFEFEPGKPVQGSLLLRAPDVIEEGSFLETRLSLIDDQSGKVIGQHEWFQVYDTVPPDVTNYRAVLLDDKSLAIQALVADKGSGVLEATGVSTEFSVDGGRTWARKAHNYKVGNFVRPTLFETVLGPFSDGTKVQVRFTAKDTAGNAQTVIPDDASAFRAPKNAEKLLQNAYVFPRTQRNPIFELEKLKQLKVTVDTLRTTDVDIRKMDLTKPNPLGLSPDRMKDLGFDLQRLADLKDDLNKLGDLNFDVDSIEAVPATRVKSLGQIDPNLTTLEFEIK